MNPFKPTQTLQQIKDILLPEVQAITDSFPGVKADIVVNQKMNLLVLNEWKDGFAVLPYSVPRAQLESTPYMAQFGDQVSALAQIVVDQQHPDPNQQSIVMNANIQNRRDLIAMMLNEPQGGPPTLGQIKDIPETSVEGTFKASVLWIFDGAGFVRLFTPQGERVVDQIMVVKGLVQPLPPQPAILQKPLPPPPVNKVIS